VLYDLESRLKSLEERKITLQLADLPVLPDEGGERPRGGICPIVNQQAAELTKESGGKLEGWRC